MRIVAIMVVLIVSFGCSKANDNAPSINPVTGKHPKGWAVADSGGLHPAAYTAGPSACYECHGKNMAGGISSVSCFSSSYNGMNCHPGGPSSHPAGWSAPAAHGSSAKAPSLGRDGLIHCQDCHGGDYAGGSSGRSCLNAAGCHGTGVMAPHSPKPWLSRIGGRTHSGSDASNAAACASCHTAGANSSRKPSPAAPAGTPAGCFNNTLCHGVEGHPQGWNLPSSHGAAAIARAGGDKGFAACTTCHGTKYDGGTAQQSCLNTSGCHTVTAPHPPKPWKSATGYSHTKCDTTNSRECAQCHTAGANSTVKPNPNNPKGLSGCFDNTLCHGTIGHVSGWVAPSLHGAEAKKAPTASTGFSSCQTCHGAAFINGAAVTCFNGLGCHGFGVNAPHPAKPWFSNAAAGLKHTTTDPANAGTCAICHTAGANSTIKPPFPATNTLASCFNNTLCHFHQIPYAPSNTIPASLHGGEAKKDLTICQACHGEPGRSAFNGITLADGTSTTACSSCHTHAKAHPTDWQGAGSYSHRSAGNKASACALCHDVRQGATAPLPASPSCFSVTFTNALGQTRTCHSSGPGAAPHSVPYNNHNATARNNFSYCLGCHQIAVNSTTPPGCMNCHLANPQQSPNNCVSCHSRPPNGSVYPNVGSSHATHNALNVADLCAECHSGLGLGTVDHQDRAQLRTASVQANPVVFGTLARTAGLNPGYSTNGTCLNTYCHGGSLAGGSNKAPQWGQSGYMQGCGTCHGFPPAISAHTNVTSATSCASCHQHVNSTNNGFTDPTKHINGKIEAVAGSAHAFPYPGALHATAGATPANCSSCHNTTAPGPYPVDSGVAPNCRACHISSLGVGCTDCHATPPNGTVAPNRNLSHTPHNSSATMSSITCNSCHQGGGSGTLAHGYGVTRVTFNAFVGTGGLTPVFNATSKQCTNTYCHGATLVGGSNKSPQWGQSGSTGCGSCHGFPPVITAHLNVTSSTSCAVCHQHVNGTNSGFVDVSKHINGQIEANAAASHAYPYPGSLHLSAAGTTPWSNCTACHTNTLGGTYPPVQAGTAPNCTGCHIQGLRAPSGTSSCWDCHGASATDGRPNGSTFPNRRGGSDGHNRETHRRTCTTCHPITTGSTAHGWSNNAPKSTNAQVLQTLNWIPGSRGPGQGSCNPSAGGFTGCHGSETGWY